MQLTTQLADRKVVEVWKNGSVLVIRCEDGHELSIGWRDPETGAPLKGEPVILTAGKRIVARTEIMHRREVGL
jgi:hypothetical protein